MKAIERFKAMFLPVQKAPTAVRNGPFAWHRILEPFAGAWQRGIEETTETITTYSTVYACLSRISGDIGKLPFRLVRRDTNGLWRETTNPAWSPVLRKPNHFQSAAQFRVAWILSELMYGNAYLLKRRDARGVVTALYVLDPTRVTPMVSDSSRVFYKLQHDRLNTILEGTSEQALLIPASEIIHDREACLFHPLIGMPPLSAAILPATKNHRINEQAAMFFGNSAQPGGILTGPAGMSETDAEAVEKFWNENFSGRNAGKIAVIGADLKFTSFAMNGVDAQLVEQLRYSDEQVCHAFGVPPHKVGIGALPAGLKIDDLNLLYYTDALQARIERMEDALDDGLNLPQDIGVDLDLEPLLRMDMQKQAQVEAELVKAGIKAPNESRRRFNLDPVAGGESPFLQQQNYSLGALARRDAGPDPFGTGQSGGGGNARAAKSTDWSQVDPADASYERSLSPGARTLKHAAERAAEIHTGSKPRMRYSESRACWLPVGEVM